MSLVEEQAAPTPNDKPAVWELVQADMKARDAIGRERYGTPLQPGNGRDALVDLYQELLDAVVYTRQAIEERSDTDCVRHGIERRRCGCGSTVPLLPHREAMAVEINRLQAREQELLESNTRLVEARRAIDRHAHMVSFFNAVGQRVPEKVGDITDEELRLGASLIVEEAQELLEAAFDVPTRLSSPLFLAVLQNMTRIDLPKLIDACIDLAYVVEGMLVRLGVDSHRFWGIVHDANMNKAGGPKDPITGKALKPEGWTPPDIEGELRRQGYAPKHSGGG